MAINIRILILVALLHSTAVHACKYVPYTTKERITNSTEIYIGVISGIRIPYFETRDGSRLTKENIRGIDMEYRISINKIIRGTRQGVITIPIYWCGGGEAELGNEAVAYLSNNRWYISDDKEVIKETASETRVP